MLNMKEKNLTLSEIADRLTTIGYVIGREDSGISKDDLYAFAADLEFSVAALLVKAKEKETASL